MPSTIATRMYVVIRLDFMAAVPPLHRCHHPVCDDCIPCCNGVTAGTASAAVLPPTTTEETMPCRYGGKAPPPDLIRGARPSADLVSSLVKHQRPQLDAFPRQLVRRRGRILECRVRREPCPPIGRRVVALQQQRLVRLHVRHI